RARLLHLEDLAVQLGQDPDASKKLFEAIVVDNDLLPRRFLDLGVAAAKSVGRILVTTGVKQGRFGTGTIVGSQLILTNNHVIDPKENAANATIEFGYYDGDPAVPQKFQIRPDEFFFTSEELDFTLVGVETDNGQARLSDYGRIQLLGTSGKALI